MIAEDLLKLADADIVGDNVKSAYVFVEKLQSALDTSLGSPSAAYQKKETVSSIELLLAKFHEEIWEGAENGQDYDLAGKDTAKEIIALFQSLTSNSGQ